MVFRIFSWFPVVWRTVFGNLPPNPASQTSQVAKLFKSLGLTPHRCQHLFHPSALTEEVGHAVPRPRRALRAVRAGAQRVGGGEGPPELCGGGGMVSKDFDDLHHLEVGVSVGLSRCLFGSCLMDQQKHGFWGRIDLSMGLFGVPST